MPFFQTPPAPGDPLLDDRVLRAYLDRALPPDLRPGVLADLEDLAAEVAGPLARLHEADRGAEPVFVPFDAWGRRIDAIEPTPLWREMARVAARRGLVATAYERQSGDLSRVHQFALVYLVEPVSDVYTCPLAMTDGAARTLLASGRRDLVDRAVPRLTSRDPERAWTSGQWMTERTGGSDVGRSETEARRDGDRWRLYGTKWFASAASAPMALALARPQGNPPGGGGLALFYVETRDEVGRPNGIRVLRLKDKLGTRKVPTAEIDLYGALAQPVAGTTGGVRAIAPMLTVTRVWNAVGAVAGMRRAVALARSYARERIAFGAPLARQPLHVETLADMQAVAEGAFHLAFRAVELLGADEGGALGDRDASRLRLVVPIAKIVTARQAVAVASEALECFGGAGYVEDTGLPRMLRDAQVLPIWEGTTNVLALDVLRAIRHGADPGAIVEEIEARAASADRAGARGADLAEAARAAVGAARHALAWLDAASSRGRPAIEAGARRFAMTLGLALEAALLVDHAAWSLATRGDARPAHAARRLARLGLDRMDDAGADEEARALALDE